jgi:transketolase
MRITGETISELKKEVETNRKLIVKTLHTTGGGHFGGCLSEVEILTVLYWSVLRIDSKNPKAEDRDYLIMSKGHGAAGLGTILVRRGFIDESHLPTFNRFGSIFGVHTNLHMAGVEHPTGSLGHGLSVGLGLALGLKLDKKPNRVFVVQGDGELQEGSVWEAAMAAPKWKLGNLITVIDRNMVSMDGPTEEVMPIEPLEEKWRSFGWEVLHADGHDVESLLNAFKEIPQDGDKPVALIARTVKGKGVSFMENDHKWHYGKMQEEQYEKARAELGID